MNRVQIGELAEIVNGFAFDSDYFNSTGEGIPIVRIRDVVGGVTQTYYSGQYSDDYVLRNGDILIGMDGEFNIAPWRGGKALLNQRVCKVVPQDEVVDATFLRFRLGLVLKEIEASTPFVTVKHLSSEDLKRTEIEIPGLEEQQCIARVLDRADRLRRMRRYAQEMSETFLQAVFVRMFGDPRTNPMGWTLSNIQSIASQVTDGEHVTPQRTSQGIKLLSARNIKDGYIDFDAGLDYISESEYQRIRKRFDPQFGDILMSCSGTVGRVATVNTRERFSMVRSVALIKPNRSMVHPYYVEHYLRSGYGQELIQRGAKQSSQANIFGGPIREIAILVPRLALQEQFARIVQRFERLRGQQWEAERQAEKLFQALLQRAFSGGL